MFIAFTSKNGSMLNMLLYLGAQSIEETHLEKKPIHLRTTIIGRIKKHIIFVMGKDTF